MIDQKGNWTLPIEYNELGNYSPNGLWGKKGADLRVIVEGTLKVVPGADRINDFLPSSSLTYARKDGKWGFINKTGDWAIEPAYEKVRAFSNGLAPFASGKAWGYLNEKGEQAIAPTYKDAEVFSQDGLAPVKDKKWGFVDTSGKLVVPMEYDITAGLSFVMSGFKKGFINGLARVKSKSGWGFLNEKGELLANKWFQNVESFVEVGQDMGAEGEE